MTTQHTKETLSAMQENTLFIAEHGRINERDVQTANIMSAAVSLSRRSWQPQPSDILKTSKKTYHIDKVDSCKTTEKGGSTHCVPILALSLCEMPGAFTPFVSAKISSTNNTTISLSTSGGPWTTQKIKPNALTLQGQKVRTFQFFGHNGPTGHGAVTFPATVNVWKFNPNTDA